MCFGERTGACGVASSCGLRLRERLWSRLGLRLRLRLRCVCVCAALVWNVRDDGMAIVTLDRKAVSMGGMLGVVVDVVVASWWFWLWCFLCGCYVGV